jgi:NADH-quinone oxidoreductase subunit J
MPHCLFSAAPAAEWWPIVPPLLAGGAAIYLLLPRPRAYPVLWGAALGLLALILTLVLLTRSRIASVESILFWSFSALAIVSGALLVTQHNSARAALAFAVVVLSTCGLFMLLAAPFLMAATIIIYAGAIIVTFLFIIMLAQQIGLSDADDRSREPALATITGFVLLGTLLFVLQRYDRQTHEIDPLLERTRHLLELDDKNAILEGVGSPLDADPDLFKQYKTVYHSHGWEDFVQQVETVESSWDRINVAESDADKWKSQLQDLLAIGQNARHRLAWLPPATDAPYSNLSGAPPTLQGQRVRRDETGLPRMPADNAAYLGRSLFTDFLLPVELGGTLLLVATVGAIAIAFRRS